MWNDNPCHPLLFEVVNANRQIYNDLLMLFLEHIDKIQEIRNSKDETDEDKIAWNNGFCLVLILLGFME